MSKFIKSITARNVYGRYDVNQEFTPGLNILYGRNGAGKTTLLHIIANILSGDYFRLAFLLFDTIDVVLDDTKLSVTRYVAEGEARIKIRHGRRIVLDFATKEARRNDEMDDPFADDSTGVSVGKAEKSLAVCRVAYFPAFRAMIEAWASVEAKRRPRYVPSNPMLGSDPSGFARELFGDFVPDINYPSPLQIQRNLSTRIQQSLNFVSMRDRRLLEEAFLGIFQDLLDADHSTHETHPDGLLAEIKHLSNRLALFPLQSKSDGNFYARLRSLVQSVQEQAIPGNIAVPVLEAYRELLDKKIKEQEQAFASINKFLESINAFLAPKKMQIARKKETTSGVGYSPRVFVEIVSEDKSVTESLQMLSSGERQILTLLYACSNMSEENVVLIDEPEISLHIDWQRQLLSRMTEQLGNRQIIACTHSPVVGTDHEETLSKLKLSPSRK